MPLQGTLTNHDDALFNEALIVSELERRYYLYLVGGEYEKLFYAFEPSDGDEDEHAFQKMTRIKLDVEVPEAQRKGQGRQNCADPVYKNMLDYMLKQRINVKIERDDFIHSCQEVDILKTIWQGFGKTTLFEPEIFSVVNQQDWLVARFEKVIENKQFVRQFNLDPTKDLEANLKIIGYPLFILLLPRLCGDVIYERMHPILRPLFSKIRSFSRCVSGAIGTLALSESIQRQNKWMVYMLGAISMFPSVMLINAINEELNHLITQQKESIRGTPEESVKMNVLDHFEFSGDFLMDILRLDEVIKPHLLEELELKHFDPSPYILGYAEDDANISTIFFKSRAYALYRQLYRTGRIHTHETAIFLKKHKITKRTLHALNELDFTDIQVHLELHKKLLGS